MKKRRPKIKINKNEDNQTKRRSKTHLKNEDDQCKKKVDGFPRYGHLVAGIFIFKVEMCEFNV